MEHMEASSTGNRAHRILFDQAVSSNYSNQASIDALLQDVFVTSYIWIDTKTGTPESDYAHYIRLRLWEATMKAAEKFKVFIDGLVDGDFSGYFVRLASLARGS